MPIYEYTCSACAARTDILHGLNDAVPTFCPLCGAEGTLRKAFAPPTIVFKGSGWAKKDRASSSNGSRGSGQDASDGGGGDAKGAKTGTPDAAAAPAAGASHGAKGSKPETSGGDKSAPKTATGSSGTSSGGEG